ncbi:MAG: hypothetical protein ACXW3O_00535 [Brevundimonas sp.]
MSAALPPPFDRPPDPAGVSDDPATLRLTTAQIQALLERTPSYFALETETRDRLKQDLVKIGAHAAALVRDDWAQSARLGQRPLIRRRERVPVEEARVELSAAQTAADQFRPAATGQVATITRDTLQAIAFPTFVADLINGSFRAIVDSSIQQMQAFTEMIENVSKTVDEFMVDNVSDNQAREWLIGRYPQHVAVDRGDEDGPRLTVAEGAPDVLPDFRGDLNLPETVSSLDESMLEEMLVPAARRRLAQARLRLLSTLVMMGLQRIVVRSGKIKAGMKFKIDASDRVRQQEGSRFGLDSEVSGGVNYGIWNVQARISVTYVTETRTDSDSAIDVGAELTGEVEIAFETDYLPLARLAPPDMIERIRENTPVPDQNQPPGAVAPPTLAAA